MMAAPRSPQLPAVSLPRLDQRTAIHNVYDTHDIAKLKHSTGRVLALKLICPEISILSVLGDNDVDGVDIPSEAAVRGRSNPLNVQTHSHLGYML
jgi:hypothetical protein